ncbi:hypothetical protein O6H91_03G103100 [Diphasiastrum complanatum]|uniref:Uncharacterized protein n=1 Tax=Diphasiastrum complanatum TaxID=34168 RepID=A0ACC2EA10_DIPCM|nr:hypothetical protein O6H91_03G103100 [Diphasiastrum complanatum]
MGRYPTGPKSCLTIPTCHVIVKDMGDPAPITIFAFWGILVSTITVFQLFKFLQTKKRPIQPFVILHRKSEVSDQSDGAEKSFESNKPKVEPISGKQVNVENLVDMEAEKELQVTGYTWSIFGECCYLLCCLTSLQWMCLFILILFDTYNKCEVGSIDNLCFFGDNVIFGTYELNGKVFFVVWWLAAIWFTTWVLFKGQVHNWFRMPCALSCATVAHIWARDQEEILTTNVYPLMIYFRRMKNIFLPPESCGHSEIANIVRTKSGQCLFWFQGQRFVIQDNTLVHATWKVGDLFSDYYQEVKGLSIEEADHRLEYLGLNEIPFKPEPLLFTIYDELFSFFHVYQLVMYLLQFWNSYLFVASLSTCIVLLSASITIYTRRRSQFTIAKITEYVTETEVLRSGTWKKIDSRSLVPGDLIRVCSDWLLPCDMLIIQGSCICDESALTGEAMPVQKYNAPNTTSFYRPEGHGAHHTLFSGTTVLQAGTMAQADVLAIVSATGMATSKGELLSSILYPQKMLFKYDEELPIVVVLLIMYGLVCFAISLQFQVSKI